MASARSVAIIALLLVLAVGLFSVIYFTTRGSDSNDLSSPFQEFSASVSSQGAVPYTAKVYSRLTFSGEKVSSWFVQAVVDYEDGGLAFQNVYSNGNSYKGYFNNSVFNLVECVTVQQAAVLEEGTNSFVPTKLNDLVPHPSCPDCENWRLELAGQTFLMLFKDRPRVLVARDEEITVTEFEYGKNLYTFPDMTSFDSQCFPETVPDAPVESPSPDPEAQAVHAEEEEEPGDLRPNRIEVHDFDMSKVVHATSYKLHEQRRQAFEAMNVETQNTCAASSRGDGRCDTQCNNAANGYDNGDCCPGTCLPGRKFACGSYGFRCVQPGNRPCLFVHGLGMTGPNSAIIQSENVEGNSLLGLPKYWADFAYEASGRCSQVRYILTDTNNRVYHDTTLINTVYNHALSFYQSNGVIIAHSMGNVILGAACMYQNNCAVKWYDLGGPIRGSKAADVQGQISAIFGQSTSATSLRTSYQGMMNSNTRRDELSRTIAQRALLKGAVCATTGMGSGGRAGIALGAVKTIVYGWKQCVKRGFLGICTSYEDVLADGVVGIEECERYGLTNGGWGYVNRGSSAFSTNFRSAWFRYDGNHYDLTGRGNYHNILEWIRLRMSE